MEIKSQPDKREEIIYLFLLNMNLLTPKERSVIVKLLDYLYGFPPIEEDFRQFPVDKPEK